MKARFLVAMGGLAIGLVAAAAAAPPVPLQASLCSGCARPITERTRRPCPSCGSMNRLVIATADDRVATADRAS